VQQVYANLPIYGSWPAFFRPDELLFHYEPKPGSNAERAGGIDQFDREALLKSLRAAGIAASGLGEPIPIYGSGGTGILQPVYLLDWVAPARRRLPDRQAELDDLGRRTREVWDLARTLNGPEGRMSRFDAAEHTLSAVSPNWIAMPHY